MKKRYMAYLTAAALLLSGSAMAAKSDVTWEKLMAANEPAAVLEKHGAMRVESGDGDITNVISLVMAEDGLGWSNEDGVCLDGAHYAWSEYDEYCYVSFFPPEEDRLNAIENYIWDADVDELSPSGKIKEKGGQLIVKVAGEDKNYGITAKGEARFDAETLLLTDLELTVKMGMHKSKTDIHAEYGESVQLDLAQYEIITGAEDAVTLRLHTPEGEVREYKAAPNALLSVYSDEEWSLCRDEACTQRIDDLGWVKGDSADLYLCRGYVDPAAPDLDRVVESSSFETMMARNYDTYNLSYWYEDGNGEYTGGREVGWYVDEAAGMAMFHETRDADYAADYSALALNGAWYEWDREAGYRVEFYDDLAQAEALVAEYVPVLDHETLSAPMVMNEYGIWCVPREVQLPGGVTAKHEYAISPDNDCVEYVRVDEYDADGALVRHYEYGVSGNGGNPCERDVFAEFTKPEGASVIRLTVVSPAGEATYAIRSDAAIGRMGGSLYADEALTKPVTDLSWVSGRTAVVYCG